MKKMWDAICFVCELVGVLFSKDEARQLDYDNGCGEVER